MDLFRRNHVFTVAILAFIASGIFVAMSPLSTPGPDAIQYDRLGFNLASGNGFSLSETSPFSPTMAREPAYPAFLAVIYRIFGHNTAFVFFMQILLHSATAVLAYYLAKGIFSETAALWSGIMTALFPTLSNMPAYLLSETFFTFVLSLGIFIYGVALMKKNILVFVLAGAVFAVAALTKVASTALPLTIVAVTALTSMSGKIDLRRQALGLICFLAVFSLTLSTWVVRNHFVFGDYSLTLRGGEALWSRAEKLDDSPKEILTTACFSISEFLGNKIFPGASERPERYLFKDFDKAGELRAGYVKKGLSGPAIDAIFRNEAMVKIKKMPVKYAAYTFIEGIKMASFSYLPILNETAAKRFFGSIGHGGMILSAIKGVIRLFAYPVLILFIISFIKNKDIWNRWIALFTTAAYFNIVYSLLDAIGRYAVPLIPFYCIMISGLFFCSPGRVERGAAA